MSRAYKFLISLLISASAAAVGGFVNIAQVPTWYAGLEKPSFNPPVWVFQPAWSFIYLLIAISLFLIWNAPRTRHHTRAYIAFSVQLALNVLWSVVFFGLHQIGISLAVIIAMWLAIAVCVIAFWPIRKAAAILLLPYLGWVAFATALNYAIWQLN